MQSNSLVQQWLNNRGITTSVINRFGICSTPHKKMGEAIKIPIDNWNKYRRHPLDDRKPKYMYDFGGKVTLYGAKFVDWTKPVLITEGELDTLVAWSNNIQAVSSTGGAMSFQAAWADLFATCPEIYIAFDNDESGAKGMVKTLNILPSAKIILIPQTANVKDITDYVTKGGDLHQLLETAQSFNSIESVETDRRKRSAIWQSTYFHDAYLDDKRQQEYRCINSKPYHGDDKVLRARSYPMTSLLDFNRHRKMCCPWHNEQTPSLVYYPKTNTAYCFGACGRRYDAIDAYMLKHGLNFTQAIKQMNDELGNI